MASENELLIEDNTVSGNDPVVVPDVPDPDPGEQPGENGTQQPDHVVENLEQINEQLGKVTETITAERTAADSSGTYSWTYKGVTNVAFTYDSVAFQEYYKHDDGSFVMATNGDLVESGKRDLFEEFLFYRSGHVSECSVRVFSDYPEYHNIRTAFCVASDGQIIHVDEIDVYERYLADEAQEAQQMERQAQQDEQIDEYLESINQNLVYLTEMGFSDREDLQALVASAGLQLQDNEVLGENLQILYETVAPFEKQFNYLCIAETVNGFLLAVGVGILIAKLIIERFK